MIKSRRNIFGSSLLLLFLLWIWNRAHVRSSPLLPPWDSANNVPLNGLPSFNISLQKEQSQHFAGHLNILLSFMKHVYPLRLCRREHWNIAREFITMLFLSVIFHPLQRPTELAKNPDAKKLSYDWRRFSMLKNVLKCSTAEKKCRVFVGRQFSSSLLNFILPTLS